VVLLAAACAPAAPPVAVVAARHLEPVPRGGRQPAQSAGEPQAGGRVILGSFADAKVLSPVHSTDVTSSDVHSRIYESLIVLDPKTGEPTPRLAEKFEVSPTIRRSRSRCATAQVE